MPFVLQRKINFALLSVILNFARQNSDEYERNTHTAADRLPR